MDKYQAISKFWGRLGPSFLPFADAASKDLPLSRILRLSLFQVSVGMAIVLLTGTLNRVMIVELYVPAWIVATVVSLPLLIAPFRAFIGYKSDTRRSYLGVRRVPLHLVWIAAAIRWLGHHAIRLVGAIRRCPWRLGRVGQSRRGAGVLYGRCRYALNTDGRTGACQRSGDT